MANTVIPGHASTNGLQNQRAIIHNFNQMSNDKVKVPGTGNDHQTDSAHAMISNFFDCYQLHELKEELWEWFSNAIARENSIYDIGLKRSNLVTLYENIELLIDAAWLIHSKDKDLHI